MEKHAKGSVALNPLLNAVRLLLIWLKAWVRQPNVSCGESSGSRDAAADDGELANGTRGNCRARFRQEDSLGFASLESLTGLIRSMGPMRLMGPQNAGRRLSVGRCQRALDASCIHARMC